MNVHACSVGRVSLPARHVRAVSRTLPGRYVDVMRDDSRLEPLPIWCWVIDHPGGVIVVDVGETTAVFGPRAVDLGARLLVDRDGFDLSPADELAAQLDSIGIDPGDVTTVVLTHLHFDHAGAVDRFPNADVLVSRREYWSHRLLPLGSSLHRWSDRVEPTLVRYDDDGIGPFDRSERVTDDGAVQVVPTPGHTPGHQSVIVRQDDGLLFLAGDTTFTERQLLEDEIVGIALDARASRRTMGRIRRLAATEPTVYLPSHDPDAADRLENRTPTRIDGGV